MVDLAGAADDPGQGVEVLGLRRRRRAGAGSRCAAGRSCRRRSRRRRGGPPRRRGSGSAAGTPRTSPGPARRAGSAAPGRPGSARRAAGPRRAGAGRPRGPRRRRDRARREVAGGGRTGEDRRGHWARSGWSSWTACPDGTQPTRSRFPTNQSLWRRCGVDPTFESGHCGPRVCRLRARCLCTARCRRPRARQRLRGAPDGRSSVLRLEPPSPGRASCRAPRAAGWSVEAARSELIRPATPGRCRGSPRSGVRRPDVQRDDARRLGHEVAARGPARSRSTCSIVRNPPSSPRPERARVDPSRLPDHRAIRGPRPSPYTGRDRGVGASSVGAVAQALTAMLDISPQTLRPRPQPRDPSGLALSCSFPVRHRWRRPSCAARARVEPTRWLPLQNSGRPQAGSFATASSTVWLSVAARGPSPKVSPT